MKSVLVINSSLNGNSGNSNKAAQKYVDAQWENEQISVTEVDLNSYGLAHLGAEEMQAWRTPDAERTPEQHALARHSDGFIEQLINADEIVLAVPMYNFGIPSTLKAYFDRIARAGKTFEYSAKGPRGLIKGKKATVLAARGGKYQGTPMDTQGPYIKNFLEFIGFTDINFIYIEGLAMGENSEKAAWEGFDLNLNELFPILADYK
ncbi:MAG: NAD(P)H-dependent oxidoreductase [Pseudomonadota bacterium]